MVVVSLIILFAVLTILFLIYLTSYLDQDKGIELSFDEFYKYYCLNPDSWFVSDTCIAKYSKNMEYDFYRCRIKFASYWKYLIFIHMKNKNIKLKNYNKKYANFLEEIQLDIEKCRKEANKYNQQGIDILNEVIYNDSKKQRK